MPEDMLSPTALQRLVCRPALPKDTQDMLEITRWIWDGHDYVPRVWQDWLADWQGLLAVAEYGGRIVGFGKLTRLSEDQWWLEGLRVHPEFEGKGIATHLTEYLLAHWVEAGRGMIRLATVSNRFAIHRISERNGFTRMAEVSTYFAPVDPETPAPASAQNSPIDKIEWFTPLRESEASAALHFIQTSELLPLQFGLLDTGWQWAPPEEKHIRDAIQRGWAWWWRDRGLLLLVEDEDDDGVATPVIEVTACSLADLPQLLTDYRRLAAQSGFPKAGWMAPVVPEIEAALLEAGFKREWDLSLFIFEKRHPAEVL